MKKLLLLPAAAALLVTAGCRDAQVDKVPTANAEAAVKASLSIAGGGEAAPRSTVCIAFDNELDRRQGQLAADPENVELQASVASAELIIADLCE